MPAYADNILSSLGKALPDEQYNRLEEDVVVSGMSGRFPESDSLAEFASNLYDGIDMVTEDDRRWTPGLYGLPTRSGKIPSLNKFDAAFFNVSPRQAHRMDPQIRILLEVTYEAIMDAGVHPNEIRGKKIGVYVGASSSESEDFLTRDPDKISGYELTGCCRAMFANRISYAFDLKGPSFAVDTACSSSLVALHNAWAAMSRGEIEAAIVAGSNLTLKPQSSLQFHALSMLSEDGKCKAFDAKGDGYVRSEAIAAVFLQRRKDCRRIYAHVVQALTNTDGSKSEGITFPSGEVQKKLLDEVYQKSGVDPSFVSYVEAHGTGTKAGDPQEVNALADVFCKNRSSPLLLGSVKSNMGHSEPTSGLCSLVKVCLAMQRQEIAGNLHFTSPNSDIPALSDGSIQVVDKNTQWTGKYAALNCFGFGGANVHVLVKAPESRVPPSSPERIFSPVKKKTKTEEYVVFDVPRLLLASGRTAEGVSSILEEFTSNKNEDYAALIDDLSKRGSAASFRGYAVVGAMEDRQITKVTEEIIQEPSDVWLIFSGMGSQWKGCGERLMQLPSFANAVRKCQRAVLPFSIDVIDIITNSDSNIMDDTTSSFVAIAAVQVGLINVLKTAGLKNFAGFVGHSVGELGCGFADGALNEEQTVLAAYWRGRAVQEAKLEAGGMAAVGLSAEEAEEYLVNTEVKVACHNSDTSVTISGPKDQVESIRQKLTAADVFCRSVNSGGIAFHHPSLAKAAPRLLEELKKIITRPVARSSKWISSSVNGDCLNKDIAHLASAEYFVNNLLSPVRFAQALKKIPPGSVLIEVAPHALMQAVLRRALPEYPLVPLVRKDAKDVLAHLLEGLGKMYNMGMEVDVSALYPGKRCPVPGNTPSIAPHLKWDHSVDWDVVSSKASSIDSEFKLEVDLNSPEFSSIAGHCIDGRVLYPATGYIVLAWRALAKMVSSQWDSLPVTLTDVVLHQATVLTNGSPVVFTVRILLSKGDFEILSGETVTASGKIQVGAKETKESDYIKAAEREQSSADQKVVLNGHDIYKELRLRGYYYGGVFKGVQSSNLEGTKGLLSWNSDWVSFMDTMLQFSLLGLETRSLYLPSRIRKVQINTEVLNETLQNVADGENISLEVTHDPWMNITSSCGVEIHGLKATLAPRRAISDEPLLENYKFYPGDLEHIENITFNESVRLLGDLFIENSTSLSVKILHLSSALQPDDRVRPVTTLVKCIMEVMDKYPLLNVDYAMHLRKNEFSDIPLDELEDCGVRVVDEIDGDLKVNLLVIENERTAVGGLEVDCFNDAFVLAEGKETAEYLKREQRLVTVGSSEQIGIFLMKKPRSEETYEELLVPNDANFSWVEDLKHALARDTTTPLWLISEGHQNSGLVGMVNCLKNEPGGRRLRCLVDPPSTVRKDLSLWKSLVAADMVVNVFQNGILGTYRHSVLPPRSLEPCSQAYLNVLTRGDLTSLTWLQSPDFEDLSNLEAPTKELKGCEMKVKEKQEGEGFDLAPSVGRKNTQKDAECTNKLPKPFAKRPNVCKVYFAPLNFRDIMLASGKLPPDALPGNLASKDCILGLEFAGLNSEGERVMGLLASGGLATHVECDPLLTWKIPLQWTLEEAATVPVVYSTAYYALIIRGNLKKGESVLIHSGSGGVGQAAISIALYRGATVYTTVSNDKKKQFLMERFPQLQDRNFCASRDSTFALHILRETKGQGVDLVLNSLAGDLLQASVRCLKQHGRFLEIGKADLAQNTSLGMSIFLKNIAFHGILLDALFDGSPSERLLLQNTVYEGIASGEVRPLPATTFNHNQAEEAFRFMASGKHIGKVLLKVEDETPVNVEPVKPTDGRIDAIYKLWPKKDLVYVITGGLGGLGLELCDWLIQRGATKIVLTSRRGISSGYQALCVKRWLSFGASVKVLTYDASTTEGAKLLIEKSMEDGQIGGIFHLAMVLNDSLIENQTSDTFVKVAKTKADGAVALDLVSRELCPYLHIWVTFSSVAAGRGNPGQSNYAWANSVSERVVENRVRDGYPGTAIQWGGIADVGVLADTLGDIEVGGTKPQSIRSVLDCLDRLIGSDCPVTSSLCLVSKKSKGKDGAGGKCLLSAVVNILGIRDLADAPMTLSLGDLGMDSLMAVEIKQTLEREADTVLTAEQIRDLTLQNIKDLEENPGGSPLQESQTGNSSPVKQSHDWRDYPLVPKTIVNTLSAEVVSAHPTLILLSPIQGNCEPLRELASKLNVSVWGLQYTPEVPNNDIVKLASFLLEKVEDRLEGKPIYLCGYSFGACVAYEMAKQLEQRNKTISKLIFLDGSHSYVSGVIDFHRNKIASRSNSRSITPASNSPGLNSPVIKSPILDSRKVNLSPGAKSPVLGSARLDSPGKDLNRLASPKLGSPRSTPPRMGFQRSDSPALYSPKMETSPFPGRKNLNQLDDFLRNVAENESLVTFAFQLCSCNPEVLRDSLVECDSWEKKLECAADTIIKSASSNKNGKKLDKFEVKLAADLFFQRLTAGFEHSHDGTKVAAPTLLVRAQQNKHSLLFGTDYGLQEVLSSPVTVKEVEGTHETFIVGEGALKAAEIINEFLKEE